MDHHLRFRQIHLDFHTSEKIPGIGSEFNKKQWQETLKLGHVDSITCFATCHHGWAYFDSKFGNMHPHLKIDLLRAQMDASKEVNVNVPVYLTGGANYWAGTTHPEWREIKPDGYSGNFLNPGFQRMCFNTPYLDLLCGQIEEVVTLFPEADGIFVDIINQTECCCRWCVDEMLEMGLDPHNEADRRKHDKHVLEKYYKRTTAAAKSKDGKMPVFHNSGHIRRGNTGILKYFSHLELESLPTGGWGYDHFPMSAKYTQKLEHDFLGMTGKFQTTWGEFGGYKHPNALRYECAAMVAFGAKCSVGDQLHPAGFLDETTYSIIGEAYKEVEEKEPWCDHVENVADIAILSSEAVNQPLSRENPADIGACRILLEGHMLFDIIDSEMDFSQYKVLVLPDDLEVSPELKAKLDEYLNNGGKLFITGASILDSTGENLLFDIGAEYSGKHEYSPDYLIPAPEVKPDFLNSPLIMYFAGQKLKATTGKSLAKLQKTYFNRSFKHFCSHQHAPPVLDEPEFDAAVMSPDGKIVYLGHPLFTIYKAWGAVAYKDYCLKALKMLLGNDVSLTCNMPSTARISVMRQAGEKRTILHLLYANTVNRGGELDMPVPNHNRQVKAIEVIEELIPLANVKVELKVPHNVAKVTLEPEGREIEVKTTPDGKHIVELDSFSCHQMVVFHEE